MTKMLSPLASPFHPHNSIESFGIFNNGIPSLVPVGTDLIRGISDETMDECYPPTAEEVAEWEAVEEFVHIMARLEMLEQREERVRQDYTLLPKRWAVRRELNGKPRPAKTQPDDYHNKSHNHHHVVYNPEDEIKIVVHDRKQRNFELERMELQHSHKDNVMMSQAQISRANKVSLGGRNNHKNSNRPIQQPRK